ncbi:MAG: CDP-diacylglycerol--serine O-phosphatidyltransferase [Bryobacteraceae bacterium]
MKLSERLIDPKSPERRPRRAAYALPAMFTAGNLFLGFLAITKAFEGAMYALKGSLGHNPHWEAASIMIGVAVFLDGLDGRIARMTNTVSEFGRELDSLADVITFGVAPAILAWTFGIQFLGQEVDAALREQIRQGGYFASFLFLLCGASRLARFNIQDNPIPKNPGRPGRKYFVGLPIPAAAGMVAAIIYAVNSQPIENWMFAVAWIGLLIMLSTLMVSTWRYRSFKDFNLFSPGSPWSVIRFGCLIYLLWNYSQAVLLAMATVYCGSGIVIRIGGAIKRRFSKQMPPAPHPHTGLGNA